MRRIFPVIAAIGLAGFGVARAETAPKSLSEAGRALYGHIVGQLDTMSAPDASLRHGPIAIDEGGTGFHVVIPDVAMTLAEGGTIRLGTIEADLTPEGPDVYDVALTLPRLITVADETGAEIGHATVGESSFTGTWAPVTGGYLDQKLRLADVVVTFPDSGFEARAVLAAYEAALTPSNDSKVTGPSAFLLDGLSISDGQGHEIVRLGSLAGTSAVRALDRAAMLKLNQGFAALGEAGQPNADGTPAAPLDLSFLPTALGDIIADASTDVTLENLTIMDPTGAGGVIIDRLVLASSVTDLDGDLARLHLSYRHDGLQATGEAASPLVPDVVNLEIDVERLPTARLYVMAVAAGAMAAVAPDATGSQALAQLPALFAQSATEVKIGALDLAMAGAKLYGSGTIAGDPNATGGVVGGFTLFASGLESAIATLTANPEDAEAQQAGFFLSLLQSLGAPETAADGAPVLAYRVALDPAGNHTLNGQNLGELFSGMAGGEPGATP